MNNYTMIELKISSLPDEKPVKLTIEIPTEVYRTLEACSEAINVIHHQKIVVQKLIVPMIEKFTLSDVIFVRRRKKNCRLDGFNRLQERS